MDDTAIVSYFFTLDKKLLAFVWEKGKPLQTIYLPISEDEVERLREINRTKIKNFIFFKRDGKEIYDKLLKPLNLAAKHLIIVPDKSLWKIPFQALSADGEKYLIEEKLISYAPSVSILLEQIKSRNRIVKLCRRLPIRLRIISSCNMLMRKQQQVAEIYNSKPIINATVADFERNSDKRRHSSFFDARSS